MRILHTVASLRPETGGPARSVPGLAKASGEQGLEIHVWSPEIPAGYLDMAGFHLHRGTLEDALDEMANPDLIHDHGLWLPVNHRVARVAQQRSIKRLISPRGMLEPWALDHKKWKKRAAWWLYQRRDLQDACMLHATADSEARQFQRLGLTNPVIVIPNGVDLPTPTAHRQPHAGPRTALFLSRIHAKKGLPLLVDAWAKVRPAGWRMVVAGPDEDGHRREIETMVAEAGLSASWEFTGPLEGGEKHRIYQQAALFILPTYSENFGIAVAEALSYRIPVITTTGAPWQGLVDQQCGWWVEPQASTIAVALAKATSTEPVELEAMGDRGFEWVKSEFAWAGISKRMADAYESLPTR